MWQARIQDISTHSNILSKIVMVKLLRVLATPQMFACTICWKMKMNFSQLCLLDFQVKILFQLDCFIPFSESCSNRTTLFYYDGECRFLAGNQTNTGFAECVNSYGTTNIRSYAGYCSFGKQLPISMSSVVNR